MQRQPFDLWTRVLHTLWLAGQPMTAVQIAQRVSHPDPERLAERLAAFAGTTGLLTFRIPSDGTPTLWLLSDNAARILLLRAPLDRIANALERMADIRPAVPHVDTGASASNEAAGRPISTFDDGTSQEKWGVG